MPIYFSCHSCQVRLIAPSEFAGQSAQCKTCGATISIPCKTEEELEDGGLLLIPSQSQETDFRLQLKHLGCPDQILGVKIDALPMDDAKALWEWGFAMFRSGSSASGEISKIKYAGHVVELDNGSCLQIDPSDVYLVDTWSVGDQVVVVDDRLYRLDEIDSVSVTESE